MSYKKNSASNRDALFGGGGGGGGPKHKKNAAANRDALFGGSSGGGGGGNSSSAGATKPRSSGSVSGGSSKGYSYGGTRIDRTSKKKTKASLLSGEAKAQKLKEAEDYRKKANKCMQSGLFKRADPVSASTFYKRAAEAYEQCGEERLEYLLRMSSGDAQLMIGTYATAAADFTRAAELAEGSQDVPTEEKREDVSKLHKKAADAWKAMNENAKAGESMIRSAMAWLIDDDDDDDDDDKKIIPKRVLTALEEAIEAHVPDVLNPYGRYRQTGVSAFIDPENPEETVEKPTQQSLDMAKNHIVSRAYSHEPLWEVVYLLVKYGEYASALYATGAITTLLTKDGVSTLSLSRSYCVETILTLAMGDPIAAEQHFLNIHVQKSFYLTSRECKLAEDLFRSIKIRDIEALEEARDIIDGSNKAAMINLHQNIRDLVQNLRIQGIAKRGKPRDPEEVQREREELRERKRKQQEEQQRQQQQQQQQPQASLDDLAGQDMGFTKEDYEKAAEEAERAPVFDTDALQAELDELNFGSDEDSDDDFDLR